MIRLQKFSLGGAGILIVLVGLSLLLQGDPPSSARGDQAPTAGAEIPGTDRDLSAVHSNGGDKNSVDKSSSSSSRPLELDVEPSEFTKGELKLELTVSPSCALRGQSMTAKLVAVSGAYVSLIVAYSDGQNYGAMYAGPVAADGSLTYPWVIPFTAANGKGWVFATGHDPATEKSGSTAESFTVGGVRGC